MIFGGSRGLKPRVTIEAKAMVQLHENRALATMAELQGPVAQQTQSALRVHQRQAAAVESATLVCAE